ncbi:MAG: hypothetical protein WCJ72_13050, partial [Chryseobacterium sp.]
PNLKTIFLSVSNFGEDYSEIYYKTEVKSESIQTEMDYNIKDLSENSLMYFFDLFDDVYKIMEEPEKILKTL